ncbi:hypothetical protein CPB85DRAFT_1435714 [Mucidula mucida]|nr:hypothetical protein CPB85DRAFT_1435714 [Mucidula mucida]
MDHYPPPWSVEPDYSHLLSKRHSMETVHPQSTSTAEESVASDSTVEGLSFSAVPMAPTSRRRSSVVEATKSARLLGSISGPIRSRRIPRGRFTNILGKLKGFATGKYPSERLSISQY